MTYLPLLLVGAFFGICSIIGLLTYFAVKTRSNDSGDRRAMSDRELFKRLVAYAKPYAGSFALVVVLMLVSVAHDVISPYLVGYVEELIKTDFEVNGLIASVIVYFCILAVSMVATYFQSVILQKTGQRVVSDIRRDTFIKIESLSHEQIHKTPVGVFVTRVSNDAESVSKMFTNVIINLVKNIFLIMGVVTAMFIVDYQMTLVVLSLAPFTVLFTVLFRKFSRMVYRKEKACTTDINAFLSENLSGMKISQNFNRTDAVNARFNKKSKAHKNAAMKVIYVFGVFRPMLNTLYYATVLFIFFFALKGYLDGVWLFGRAVTAGVLVSFYMYVGKFFTPIQNLSEQFNLLQSALASAEKIFSVLDASPTVTDDAGATDLEVVKGDVTFEDVWFAYKGEDWVLKGVSFHINAGETVAFVGATGAGKTTVLSLLTRNYDVQKGRILIDGTDIRRYKIDSLRRHFGQMPQDVFLFSGTVRSNITLGDDIPEERVLAACRYVNADKLIEKLPKGLDEPVYERSNNFSQGERQILSFARMMVRSPEILLLDEATASVDTETEALIQNSLENLMNAGTMLIVAHRLSTVRKANRIIVVDGGVIAEQGSHEELIAKRGEYFRLYTLQEQKEVLAAT